VLPFELSALALHPATEFPQRKSEKDDDCGADQEDSHATAASQTHSYAGDMPNQSDANAMSRAVLAAS
jgi:hypothetical protein